MGSRDGRRWWGRRWWWKCWGWWWPWCGWGLLVCKEWERVMMAGEPTNMSSTTNGMFTKFLSHCICICIILILRSLRIIKNDGWSRGGHQQELHQKKTTTKNHQTTTSVSSSASVSITCMNSNDGQIYTHSADVTLGMSTNISTLI